MSRGKHLSLEEARKAGKLDEFAKEHDAIADGERFNRLLGAMVSGKKISAKETSDRDASED